jgi:hypothetical protein
LNLPGIALDLFVLGRPERDGQGLFDERQFVDLEGAAPGSWCGRRRR